MFMLGYFLETELNVPQKPRFPWMQFLVIVGTLAVFTALVAVFAL